MVFPANDGDSLLLQVLPQELLVLILAASDLASVANFRATSRQCRDTVDSANEHIHEALAQRIFDVFIPKTASDTGLKVETPDFRDMRAGSVEHAIACQRTASTIYDDCSTWQKLGKLACQTRSHLLTGCHTQCVDYLACKRAGVQGFLRYSSIFCRRSTTTPLWSGASRYVHERA
jgi:hypothetical protein